MTLDDLTLDIAQEIEAKIREASVVPPAIAQLKLEEAQLVEQVQSAAANNQRGVRPPAQGPGGFGIAGRRIRL